MGTCKECFQEKELTVHGLCWKCQLSGLRVGKTGCGNCKKKTKTEISKEGNTTIITRSDR